MDMVLHHLKQLTNAYLSINPSRMRALQYKVLLAPVWFSRYEMDVLSIMSTANSFSKLCNKDQASSLQGILNWLFTVTTQDSFCFCWDA